MCIRDRNSRDIKNKVDVNHYTARRLGDMAESLNQLAKAFDDEVEKSGQLTRLDGLAAMQASAALVCESCSKCNLYADSEKEDSYYPVSYTHRDVYKRQLPMWIRCRGLRCITTHPSKSANIPLTAAPGP